jgi:hypothetical protein
MVSVWVPITTAAVAATSALAGVILNSWLTRKDRALELEFKARQESKDFLIARGEDLYIHLDQMDTYVADHCRLLQAFCRSDIDFEEFRSARRESLVDREKFSVSRIKLSIRSFFPSLIPIYDGLAENLSRINILDRALMDAPEHDGTLLYRANSDAIRLQNLVATKGEELRTALAALLSDTFASRVS